MRFTPGPRPSPYQTLRLPQASGQPLAVLFRVDWALGDPSVGDPPGWFPHDWEALRVEPEGERRTRAAMQGWFNPALRRWAARREATITEDLHTLAKP